MKSVIFISVFLISEVHAQSVNLAWAKSFTGVDEVVGRGIALGAGGHVYTSGYFSDTVDFDPGSGVYNLSTTTGTYITRQDSSGNLVWAKAFGGEVYLNRIHQDKNGNLYLTGQFVGTADIDPGPGVTTITSTIFPNYIICKLDTSGNLIWARHFPGNDHSDGESIAFDSAGNLYITGYFSQTIDFIPGPESYTLSSAGGRDIFIHKLTSSGDFVWAKRIGGPGDDAGVDIGLDASGNIYITGIYSSTVDFDPGNSAYNLTSNGFTDIFIQKLDTSGNFSWVKSVGGVLHEFPQRLLVDSLSKVYVAGGFGNTVDFDPGTATLYLTSSGLADSYLIKLDSGGQLQWAHKFGGVGDDYTAITCLDKAGNIFISGNFADTVDFNPGAGVATLASAGSGDACIAKLSPNGEFIWSARLGGAGTDGVFDIVVAANNNVLVTGLFNDTADFDPSPGVYNLMGGLTFDAFVVKLTQNVTDVFIWEGTVSNVWHNPANWNTGNVPNQFSRVIIPAEAPFFPHVMISTEIRSLQMQGGIVTVKQGAHLKINSAP
jgi:hypothetical protein